MPVKKKPTRPTAAATVGGQPRQTIGGMTHDTRGIVFPVGTYDVRIESARQEVTPYGTTKVKILAFEPETREYMRARPLTVLDPRGTPPWILDNQETLLGMIGKSMDEAVGVAEVVRTLNETQPLVEVTLSEVADKYTGRPENYITSAWLVDEQEGPSAVPTELKPKIEGPAAVDELVDEFFPPAP